MKMDIYYLWLLSLVLTTQGVMKSLFNRTFPRVHCTCTVVFVITSNVKKK